MRACPLVLGGRLQYAASSDGGHLRGAPQRGPVSPALVCLDFYVLTAGKARVSSLGGCFPGARRRRRRPGYPSRCEALWYLGGVWGTGDACVWTGGVGTEPLDLRGARTPRAWLCLLLSGYFERLKLNLGIGSLKLQTAFFFFFFLNHSHSFSCPCVRWRSEPKTSLMLRVWIFAEAFGCLEFSFSRFTKECKKTYMSVGKVLNIFASLSLSGLCYVPPAGNPSLRLSGACQPWNLRVNSQGML